MDTVEPTIEYRPIPNFPGYRVGSDGSVWSCKNNKWGYSAPWRKLATQRTSNGYELVHLWQENHRTPKLVHILVLEGFVGQRPPGYWGLHYDDNRDNNHLANLYWGTPENNRQDARRNRRLDRTGKPRQRQTPAATVALIRQRAAAGESLTAIARSLHMQHQTVRHIVSGRRRKHVKG